MTPEEMAAYYKQLADNRTMGGVPAAPEIRTAPRQMMNRLYEPLANSLPDTLTSGLARRYFEEARRQPEYPNRDMSALQGTRPGVGMRVESYPITDGGMYAHSLKRRPINPAAAYDERIGRLGEE